MTEPLNPWHMGTHLRVLGETYPMNTNMTGFRIFSKIGVSSTLEGLITLLGFQSGPCEERKGSDRIYDIHDN